MKHHGKHTDFWQHRLSLKTNGVFKANMRWYILRFAQSCLKVWVNVILVLTLLRSVVLHSFWSTAKVELVHSASDYISFASMKA